MDDKNITTLVTKVDSTNVQTTLEQISTPLTEFVKYNGLPINNVLATNEEKSKLFMTFSSAIDSLPIEEREKSEYLTKFVIASAVGLFDGALNYLWNEINSEKLYNKVNIMGHNILNLSSHPDVDLKQFSRFDDLMSFVYYDFIKDNKYIQYTVDGKDYIYQIFSVNFDYQENLDLYTYGNYSKKNMKKYIDKVRKNSIYDFNVKVSDSDNIISLITCTRMYGADDQKEFIVNAKMVKNDKKLYNYKVSKNNNYKKIEKMLKGDVEDEKA